MKQYPLAALGGTFDHFHKGHQEFLIYAFSLAEKIIIGITSNKMIQNKPFAQTIESLKHRKQAVNEFLIGNSFKKRTRLVVLNDIFGPTLESNSIKALMATRLTYLGAKKINQKRKRKKLPLLPIHICPLVKSDDNRYLSSARIRQGLISRSGQVYGRLFKKTFFLHPELRSQFKKPQGRLLIQNIAEETKAVIKKEQPIKIALVGDSVVNFFIKNRFTFDYAAIDLKTGRKKTRLDYNKPFIFQVKNPAGQITSSASRAILKTVKQEQKGVIRILGEEDLIVLPFVLSLPLKSLVIYGQPGKGCVVVLVEEKIKEKFANFFS